ncbi:GTPase IMAP family member 8-like [Oncorhynchus tshawytscha]|uniref:GTPase IMAP family member 8-like n=1 Tax=Oncorhynchus tshawytscha TaxID=74940 RepID=UPI001C3DDB64|nr:GTPase IMAP family member 8-like [Oncorhynchus tshawytscha]
MADAASFRDKEELRWCATLSDPEPHVFLVMLQPEKFTQEEGDRIRKILNTLSDRSFDYSMVLTTHEDKRGHMDEDHPLNQMVRACRGRQHLSDCTQLIADVDKMVKENGGDYLTCDVFEDTSGMPCESASGEVNGKSVTVVKTPDFFAPHLTVKSLMQEIEKCKSLSAPGPHGVQLVLKPEEFTEENRNTLKLILSIFGKESFKYSMVIITHEGVAGNNNLRQMIEECGGRHHEMYKQESDHKVLTEKIEKMVEENERRYLTSNEETTHDTMTPKAQRLNVVLCGRRGAGKTSIANAILGQTESSPKSSSSSVCVKREGEVCGRPVTLIELPALYRTHLTQEEVMRETFHCVSLCDSGVHAFLLVVPLGPITDEDKGELETIQKILSSRINDFVMVLFRQDNIPVDKTAVDFVEQNADTKHLIKICGGRYKIFDASKIENVKQTTELEEEESRI